MTDTDGNDLDRDDSGPDALKARRPFDSTEAGGDRVLQIGTSLIGVSVTWLIVFAGIVFSVERLPRQQHPDRNAPGVFQAFGAWDGGWYQRICTDGYWYDPRMPSSVAFFPAFPLLGRMVHTATGLSALSSLLVVAYLAFLASAALMPVLARSTGCGERATQHATAFLLLWPMGLYFRMAYTEALMLVLILIVMIGIRLRWPMIVLALVCGAATATRAVGVTLLLPLAWDWWRRSETRTQFLRTGLLFGPVAVWGLIAWMITQQALFGDALAFVQTQEHWAMRQNPPWPARAWTLLSLEPIWSIYVPTSDAYWSRYDAVRQPLFNPAFWNPVYFVTCAALIGLGARRRWISTPEWLLSAGLLGIPYVLKSYPMMMLSHGRFTCVVLPMYLVLGRLMAGWPRPVVILVYAFCAVQLFYWSALFAAWHRVI